MSKLLGDGFHPIIWCRYIATADYVAEGLQKALRGAHSKVRVVSITGRIGDEERRAKVDELAHEGCRVLVATDCLSEGINLQHAFNAVLHYDLPWNPNRLEQREGASIVTARSRRWSRPSVTSAPRAPWTALSWTSS